MAFLQFLSGARDQEFEPLNDSASLVLGSGPEAHLRCPDPGVEAKHCTIYPAQGSFWLQDLGAGMTVFNMQRMAGSTQPLKPGDVFIVGRTYVKFWAEKPAQPGGGGGDPAALQAVQTELAAAQERASRLEAELAQASDLRARLEAAEQRTGALEAELATAKQSAEEAAARASALEDELAAAKADAEGQIRAAREEAERERAEQQEALEATRAALEALREQAEAAAFDALRAAASDSDLAAALDALRVPDALRRRLEEAIRADIEREVLRRVEGPVVPVRGLRIEGLDRDLEAELRAVRRRVAQVEAARSLGLAELPAEELERLLELARG
ncbi:MAG: FHA domain-containing protein [Planctomycetota bacterium]|nr:MAG: FHA domain-containing protein [Planctomycetota bacterium]